MGIFNFIAKIFKKTVQVADTVKEFTEDIIADAFVSVQGNEEIDNAEIILVRSLFTILAAKTGVDVPECVQKEIENGVVSGLDKANVAFVTELRRK